jgi:hypothetical protein
VRTPAADEKARDAPPIAQTAADGMIDHVGPPPPRSRRRSASRRTEVVIAPSAKIHAFGLIHWNAAAWSRPSGRATSGRSSACAPATCQAR